MDDKSSEATIPEPFDIGKEAEEIQVRQVAATTLERFLEATSEPSAPVVNLPSPQPGRKSTKIVLVRRSNSHCLSTTPHLRISYPQAIILN